jgi:hypothetical protein
MISRQYQKDVKIFHSDQDTGLGTDHDKWTKDEGFQIEWSAVYTPAQNGSAERSGGVIETKARCICLQSNLPWDLWPECAMTAGYLINRLPARQLNWKSPLDTLRNQLNLPVRDELSHLRVFGCRAYPWIPNVAKGDKMHPRAQIGYLVGYESRNIFRIWIPSKWEVIATRDVTFNESIFFDPEEIEKIDGMKVPVNNFFPINIKSIQADTEGELGETSRSTTDQQEKNQEPENTQLPTPRASKEPQTDTQSITEQGETIGIIPSPPSQMSYISESNILEGPRTRQPRQFHFSTIIEPTCFQLIPPEALDKSLQRARVHRNELPPEPKSWKKMIQHPYKQQFLAAARLEFDALKRKDTFEEVKITEKIHPIPLKWVFTYKFDTDGFLLKHKARICVRGDLQPLTDEDNYAATLAHKTFRALMAITAAFGYETKQMDAVNAFLNAELDELVYCYYPHRFEQPEKCLRLKRALYGLRKSPRLWLKHFATTLSQLGLKAVPGQPCIYTNFNGIIIFFYVDDVCFIYRLEQQAELDRILKILTDTYEFRMLGEMEWFLGIRILRNRAAKKLWLCQDAYIERIATEFGCNNSKRVETPLHTQLLEENPNTATNIDQHEYARRVGSILFAATVTRPDIARATSHLAEFLKNPSKQHLEAADRVISYLYSTRHLALEYSGTNGNQEIQFDTMECTADSAFGTCSDRRSTQGFVFKLFGGPIHWQSSKQATVTTSTTEAELLGVAHAAKELIWLRNFFDKIQFDPDCNHLLQNDNLQTIRLLTKDDPLISTKLRHVDIHQHWLRELVQNKTIKIEWIPTAKMTADGMTKALPRQKHEEFIQMLNLTNCNHLIQDDST